MSSRLLLHAASSGVSPVFGLAWLTSAPWSSSSCSNRTLPFDTHCTIGGQPFSGFTSAPRFISSSLIS